MTRLILTAKASSAGALRMAGLAKPPVVFPQRFVWGPLPSESDLAAFMAPRTTQPLEGHWLDHSARHAVAATGGHKHGFLDLVDRCESVELWFDPFPNDQLVLIWLLDYLHDHAEAAAKIVLRHVDMSLSGTEPEQLARISLNGVNLRRDHLEIGRRAWHAFRAPSPQACCELLSEDLSALPQLRRCMRELLDELPGRASGLGALEVQLLELLAAAGHAGPFDLFPGYRKPNQGRVFEYWEVGALLDGLARSAMPAISGLDEGPFELDLHEDTVRFARYRRSPLSLTPLGKAILAGRDDFSRHNPIHRWWGGTELANTNLWRWDPEEQSLIAP